MVPDRIRLSRQKGWRQPENTVNVARPTPFGNPFVAGTHGTRLECTALYTAMIDGKFVLTKSVPIETQLASYNAIREAADRLRGKNLACWCTLPSPGALDVCHARVMLEFINNHPREGSHAARILGAWQSQSKYTAIFVDAALCAKPQEKAA